MNKKTLKALKGSIEKWRKIVHEDGEDFGTDNCPLCDCFYSKGCNGCPVAEETGMPDCNDTPYLAWRDYQVDDGRFNFPNRAFDEKAEELALAEYEFLKSLLPEGETA